MHRLRVNGTDHELDLPGEMPLLWVLRDILGLTGTKFGCGVALCGACTVHVNGAARRACRLPLAQVSGEVTTIEGLGTPADPAPLQRAWVSQQVSQCGYCQPGQIMQAAALLAENPDPSESEIVSAMSGILCRCGTYGRIPAAIREAAAEMRGEPADAQQPEGAPQ